MKPVSHYMAKKIVTLPVSQSVADAVKLMRAKRIGSLLVRKNKKTVGIFTERDLLNKIDYASLKALEETPLEAVMTRKLKTVDVKQSYIEAIEKMRAHNIRHMPVTDKGRIIGIVSQRDLLGQYQNYLEEMLAIREKELEDTFADVRASEERFHTIFDNSAVAIMMADKNEKIVAWNPFAAQLLGMSDRELKGRPVKSLYSAEEWKRMRAQNIRKMGMKHHFETRVLNKRGKEIEVDISISVLKDGNGNVTGSIGIMRDITERKKLERARRESEERFRTIFDNSAVAIMMADKNEKIVAWNPFAAQLLGMSDRELKGRPVKSLYSAEEWKRMRAQNIRKMGMKHHFETRVLNKRGKEIEVDISISVLKDGNGNVTGSIGIMRDITERKKLERLKEEFAGVVSHELRTPLIPIKEGVSQVLDGLHGDTTKEQRYFLSIVLNEIDRLKRIVNNLLDVFKLEVGKVTIKKEYINIVEVTENVIATFLPRAKKKNIAVKTHYSKGSLKLFADRDRVVQVIGNLLGNALKFTEKGTIAVRITDKGKAIECSVSDTGKGISKEDLPKLFQRFQQVGRMRSSEESGTGLGLVICKDVVELHKGKMQVTSTLGKGTTFTFTLPKQSPKELFTEYVVDGLKEAVEKETSFSIIRCDVDPDREAEKRIGKEKFESAMKSFQDVVRKNLRSMKDVEMRYEESILVILPSTTAQVAGKIADRLRETLRSHCEDFFSRAGFSPTCRLAGYPGDGANAEVILEKLGVQ